MKVKGGLIDIDLFWEGNKYQEAVKRKGPEQATHSTHTHRKKSRSVTER